MPCCCCRQVKFHLKLPPCPQNNLQPLCDLCLPAALTATLLRPVEPVRWKVKKRRQDGWRTDLSWRAWKRGGGEWKCFDFYGFVSRWSLVRREPWFPQVHGVGVTTQPLLSPSASASPLSICPFRLSHVGRFILSDTWTQGLWFIAYRSSISKRAVDYRQPLCLYSSFLCRWLMYKSWISHALYIIWYCIVSLCCSVKYHMYGLCTVF